jgi:hypothetical protein
MVMVMWSSLPNSGVAQCDNDDNIFRQQEVRTVAAISMFAVRKCVHGVTTSAAGLQRFEVSKCGNGIVTILIPKSI